jgi:hypothetical protein
MGSEVRSTEYAVSLCFLRNAQGTVQLVYSMHCSEIVQAIARSSNLSDVKYSTPKELFSLAHSPSEQHESHLVIDSRPRLI